MAEEEVALDKVLERKYQALERFKENLLQSPLRGKIAKLILFGSVLRGEAKEESDIDLLVIATDELKEIEKLCSEISFNILLEMGEGVEPLIYCIDQLRYPQSYFLYRNGKIGKEIYTMTEDEMRRGEAEGYLSLARHYLEAAQRIFRDRDWRVLSDIAYNSAELAVKGLLLLKLDELPTSHRGIVSKFGELYVKGGEVEKELGRRLNDGLRLRNKARYEPHTEINEKDAEGLIKLATSLIEELERRLK